MHNLFMLFEERVPVYCENHTVNTGTLCRQNLEIVPHAKHNNPPLKTQPVNAVLGKQSLFFVEPHGIHRYTVRAECKVCTSQETYFVSVTKPNSLNVFGVNSLIMVRTMRYTQIHCVGRMQSLYLTGNTLRIP
jgi:hypothetical protein